MTLLRIQYVVVTWPFTGESYVNAKYQLHVKALIYDCNKIIKKKMEKSKILKQFVLSFRQSRDVRFFLYARRFRGYTATLPVFCEKTFPWSIFFSVFDALCSSMIVPHRNHKCQELTR